MGFQKIVSYSLINGNWLLFSLWKLLQRVRDDDQCERVALLRSQHSKLKDRLEERQCIQDIVLLVRPVDHRPLWFFHLSCCNLICDNRLFFHGQTHDKNITPKLRKTVRSFKSLLTKVWISWGRDGSSQWFISCLLLAGNRGLQLRHPVGRPHRPPVRGHAAGCFHRGRGALDWPPEFLFFKYCHGGTTNDQEEMKTLWVKRCGAAWTKIEGTERR